MVPHYSMVWGDWFNRTINIADTLIAIDAIEDGSAHVGQSALSQGFMF
jgi:hypothetical protein